MLRVQASTPYNRHKILVTDAKYPFRELSTYLLSVAQRFPLTHCGVNGLLFASDVSRVLSSCDMCTEVDYGSVGGCEGWTA